MLYEMDLLSEVHPPLAEHVYTNTYDKKTIDFGKAKAVLALNTALVKHHYKLEYWQIPDGYLCPSIPGRALYMEQLSDLLHDFKKPARKKNNKIKVLDIGTGSSLIYPTIGHSDYGWSFIGTDISKEALGSAQTIIDKNKKLKIFTNIIPEGEYLDAVVCNPPFYGSQEEAKQANTRKQNNLKLKSTERNFSGTANELWCVGGERAFVQQLITESAERPTQVLWYSTLVSQEASIPKYEKRLEQLECKEAVVLDVSVGNKKARALAWTYFKPKQRKAWKTMRW